MDQTTNRVGDHDPEPDHADPDRLKQDIEEIRQKLGGLVSELDRRRHEAFDVRLQLRRHPLPFILTGVLVTALVGATVATLIHRRRVQRRLTTRLRRVPPRLHQLRLALLRALDHPDRVASDEPRVGKKVLAAGGAATASALGKRLASRLVR